MVVGVHRSKVVRPTINRASGEQARQREQGVGCRNNSTGVIGPEPFVRKGPFASTTAAFMAAAASAAAHDYERPIDRWWTTPVPFLHAATVAIAILVVFTRSDQPLLRTSLVATLATLAIAAQCVKHALTQLVHDDVRLHRDLLPPGTTASDIPLLLARRDEAAAPVQVGAASSVHWSGAVGTQTEVCVLYIHGWSASPAESDPVDTRVAAALSANSMRMRLSGHGLTPLERAGQAIYNEATMTALQHDAALALSCARLLGRRVVLIAASTGATLALWLCSQPWAHAQRDVVAVVAISPALELSFGGYQVIKWLIALLPAGASERVLTLAAGDTRRLKVLSDEYAPLLTTLGDRGMPSSSRLPRRPWHALLIPPPLVAHVAGTPARGPSRTLLRPRGMPSPST